jgi:hypothetical protein
MAQSELPRLSSNVRFGGLSRHRPERLQCLLLTQSGHRRGNVLAPQKDRRPPFRRPEFPALLPIVTEPSWRDPEPFGANAKVGAR